MIPHPPKKKGKRKIQPNMTRLKSKQIARDGSSAENVTYGYFVSKGSPFLDFWDETRR